MTNTENQTAKSIYAQMVLRVMWLLPMLILLGQVIYLTLWAQTAQMVTVSIDGYDPRSLLSGHYIDYRVNWEQTDCTQFADNRCPREDFRYVSDRYYLPQWAATRIDKMRIISDNARFDIVFAYKKGQTPSAKQLLINGQPWQDYLQR